MVLAGALATTLAGVAPAAHAQAGGSESEPASPRTHLVLVTGLGGAPEYADAFHAWAASLRQGALDSGVAEGRIVWLAEDPSRAPGRISDRSTREALAAVADDLGATAGPDDRVMIVLIGHGTSRNGEASFNLPGPDVTGADLDEMLAPLEGRTVAVVNTAPASGPWVEALSGEDRVVITATRTAREANETQFGRFFAEAFQGLEADLDKDDRVSLLEAYRFTAREVARYYDDQNLLQTEHPMLDDDADGQGSETPTGGGVLFAAGADPTAEGEPGAREENEADGLLASRFWLGAATVSAVAEGTEISTVPDSITDPELRALYQERIALEERVAELRGRRSEMTEEAYEAELERLLLDLALKNREIREKGGGG